VDFMCHMKPNERKSSSSSGKESGNWTLVDEGGEEVQQMTCFFLPLCFCSGLLYWFLWNEERKADSCS